MIENLRQMWSERSRREQVMLAVMLALIAAIILWFGVIGGIRSGLASARASHDSATATAAAVDARIKALTRLETIKFPALAAPAPEVVRQSATDAGLELTRADPTGADGVSISVPKAAPARLLDWLVRLEAQGIFAESLSMRANGDGTVTADALLKVRKP